MRIREQRAAQRRQRLRVGRVLERRRVERAGGRSGGRRGAGAGAADQWASAIAQRKQEQGQRRRREQRGVTAGPQDNGTSEELAVRAWQACDSAHDAAAATSDSHDHHRPVTRRCEAPGYITLSGRRSHVHEEPHQGSARC